MSKAYHTTIHISQTDEEGWAVRIRSRDDSTFRALIEGLKESIPHRERNYDPGAKVWRVFDRDLLDQWLEFAKGLGVAVQWVEDGAKHSHRQRPSKITPSVAFKALHLTQDAPPEVIRASYKALASLHHPDRGGDAEKMKAVNAAYDFLTKEGNADASN